MTTRSTKPDYAYLLTLAYWTELEIILLLGIADQDGFREIVRRSRKSEKETELKFVLHGDDEYGCDPLTVIAWAVAKGLTLPIELTDWYSRQVISIVSPQSSSEDLSETERTKLLKQIGLLALVLSEKSNIYKIGNRPNASQIAEGVKTLLDLLPDANRKGVLSSSIRDSIHDGLDLLDK
jgi:hypothetical protein